MISLKQKISLKNIAVRFCLLFAWLPIGIILLVKSKTIKHKVCIGFIYFSLFALIGIPISTYIIFPIAGIIGAIVDGYDISYGLYYGLTYANRFIDNNYIDNDMNQFCMGYLGILFFTLAIYIILLIRDKIKSKKAKTDISVSKQSVDIPQETNPLQPIINENINIFDLKIGDMITDSVYGVGIIGDIYNSDNELLFDVNFVNSGRMTFSPFYRTLAKIQSSSLNPKLPK